MSDFQAEEIRERINRSRKGYRRICLELRRALADRGLESVGFDTVRRILHGTGAYRKRVYGTRQSIRRPEGPMHQLEIDFMEKVLVGGEKTRIFVGVDRFNSGLMFLDAYKTQGAEDVARSLQLLPKRIFWYRPMEFIADNGPAFIQWGLRFLMSQRGWTLTYADKGAPYQKPFVERVIRTLRCECLDQQFFTSTEEVQEALREFQWKYNMERPHMGLDYKTPYEKIEEVTGG